MISLSQSPVLQGVLPKQSFPQKALAAPDVQFAGMDKVTFSGTQNNKEALIKQYFDTVLVPFGEQSVSVLRLQLGQIAPAGELTEALRQALQQATPELKQVIRDCMTEGELRREIAFVETPNGRGATSALSAFPGKYVLTAMSEFLKNALGSDHPMLEEMPGLVDKSDPEPVAPRDLELAKQIVADSPALKEAAKELIPQLQKVAAQFSILGMIDPALANISEKAEQFIEEKLSPLTAEVLARLMTPEEMTAYLAFSEEHRAVSPDYDQRKAELNKRAAAILQKYLPKDLLQ